MRKVFQLCATAACALALASCGSSSTDEGVTLTGAGDKGLQILPQAAQVLGAVNPAAANLGDMTKFQIDLIDPVAFLLSGGQEANARMGDSPVTPTNPSTNKADYKVTHVDRTNLAIPSSTPGLVVNVIDNASPKRQTTTTSTGVIALVAPTTAGGPFTLPAGKALTADAPAFIIPDAFAELLGGLVGKTGADLGAGGYILALIIDRTTGTTVSGAKVADIANHTITYPNVGPTGLVAGTATDSLGLVLITGIPTGQTPIKISATTSSLPKCADSTTSTNCLVEASAGLANNIAFVAPIVKH